MLRVKMRVKEERDEEPEEEEEEEEDLSNSSSSSIYVNSRSSSRGASASSPNNGNMVCDACGKRTARWYCSADDAYLCHSCDQSVHAANAVSLRHERVSLLEDEEAPTNPVITTAQQEKQKQPKAAAVTTSAEQQQQRRQQERSEPFSESSRHDGSGAEFKSSSNGGSRLKRRRSSGLGSKEDQCPAAAFGSPLPPASTVDLKDGNSPLARCKSKKMIKLETPELVQASSAEQQWGRTGGCCKQEEELEHEQQQNANVERDEEVHTVPVFVSHQPSARDEHEFQTEEEEAIAHDESLQVANMGSEHSPTSGIATEAEQDGEEEQEGQESEEDSMDEADIERFLNSGADYCCDDEDAEMGSLIVAPPHNTTTTTTACAEDLEFLGFCCDEISRSCPGFEQQLDEDYYDSRFDFAIRKNNASVSDYGEVITDSPIGGDGGIDSSKIKVENESSDFLGDLLGGSSASAGGLSNAKHEHENYDHNFQQMHQHHLQRRICLRLDYEDVLNAWSDRRPFLTSESSSAGRNSKPTFHQQAVPEDSSGASDVAGSSDVGVVPDLSCGSGGAGQSVDQAGQVPVVNLGDDANAAAGGGREARVTRYREKRRTRLFSKKIRYEVRKLNAERRPRLKGRFVKRSSNGD